MNAMSNLGSEVPPPADEIDNTVSNMNTEIFSDIVLGYVNQMLMEEDSIEKLDMFQGNAALLEAAEKPFYEILVPSSDRPDSNRSLASTDGGSAGNFNDELTNNGAFNCNLASVRCSSQTSIYSTNDGASNTYDPETFPENMFAFQFRRGVEEARKFLPRNDNLVVNLEGNRSSLLTRTMRKDGNLAEVRLEANEREYSTTYGSFSRKTRCSDELDSEERRNTKQSAVYNSEETRRSEMILLCPEEGSDKGISALREAVQNKSIRCSVNGHFKGKVQRMYEPPVDLQFLLIHCAQAVSTDDRRKANALLKQVRHHSSPFGGAEERLANYFADALEARLTGTGSDKYKSTMSKHDTTTNILKGRWLGMSACPYQRISHYFNVQTILNATATASAVHIVDFGINCRFQWPSFIQRLSKRPGGPPRLRITGIDFPQPGFRPDERIQEKGRRLAEYAHVFGVPFEYRAIAEQWDAIKPEDLKIDKDEVLIVSCMYRFRNLLDETVVVDSPRNKVLNTIRRMNPKVFVLGVINASFNVPFFVTRFREALFQFSGLFDLLEVTIPREEGQRMLLERDVFGRDMINILACEGSERVERPESYKKWQVRNHMAGFVQLPLDPQIMKKIAETVRKHYHKDFDIGRDGQWLLQGWKGRIYYGLSVWKPNDVCIGFQS